MWVDRTRLIGIIVLVAAAVLMLDSRAVRSQEDGKVAVLPFQVHAGEKLDHLRQGLQEMITMRLADRGYPAVEPAIVNRHPLAFAPQLENQELRAIGSDLGARWVALGSVTQIGKRMSLDLKVVDAGEARPPQFFFMVAENLNELPGTADRLALSIYNQIAGVPQVNSVDVSGNQRIEKEAILAVVEARKGDPIDYEQLDQDLRRIYQMGFFENVETEIRDAPKGKAVVFKVTEKPSIGKIVFKGNEEIDDDDLKEELGLKLYSILDRNQVQQSVNRLKEFYRQKAFFNVSISESIEPLPNNEVLVEYQIDEGEKIYIRKIEFVGNETFDDDDLTDIMETSKKGILSFITKSGLLDRKKLEFDVQKVASYYNNHGFINAKVGEPKIAYDEEEGGLVVTIEVEEGAQYEVGGVSIEGDLLKPPEELIREVQIDKEKVFNREVLRQDVQTLRNMYADEGFAYAEVVPYTKEDDERHTVDITYRISEGDKVRFERINITGNTKTRDKVIRRELKVEEGGYFSGEGLRRSSQNLHRLGFFEEVEIQPKKGTEEDLMILDINVTERPTGSFSFGAGYSSVDQAIGTVTVQQENLFGRGQRLMAGVSIGGRSSQYDIRFTEPWLFDKPLSMELHAYNWEREYDDYTKDSLGGALTAGYPVYYLDEFTRAWSRYKYEDSEITDVESTASAIIRESEGRSVTSSLSVGLRRNSTDRAWNPSRGSINSLSVEYAGGFLGGDNYFNKYLARTTWYFPLPWETVFMTQGRWGWIDQRSGGDLPVYERFYLGGINTVRGFDYADISPIDPETGDRVGGEYMMVYNLEFRFPLIKDQGVVGLVFLDGGNVYTDESDLIERDFALSAGVGLRWYSPIGPLRLEWGFVLNRESDEPFNEAANNVEFSVGSAF